MKKLAGFALTLSLLSLGALVAAGESTPAPGSVREEPLERAEKLSLNELRRRRSDLDAARERVAREAQSLDADVAAIISDIRRHHAVTASETFGLNLEKDLVVISLDPSAAPVASK